MAIRLAKLSAKAVSAAAEPGRYGDGGGLYLVIDKGGSKRWVFLFRWRPPGTSGTGRLREMGLGPIRSVSLARAREKAAASRAQVADGIDPIALRRAVSAKPSFGTLADEYIANKEVELRNDKSVARVRRSLTTYVETLRDLPVDQISVDHVLNVLRPFWSSRPETGRNIRIYVEAVLDAAKARGFRDGDNPARLKGNIDHLLPRHKRVEKAHHQALPYAEVPALIARLRGERSMAARAVEFLILTAGRSGEVLGARWEEIDLNAALWVLPPARMKAGREHRVPLAPEAIAVLAPLQQIQVNEFIFPGQKTDRPLSNMAMEMLLRRMGMADRTTIHGFRSAFRDWAGEETSVAREVAEAALAHSVGDATERAYRRGDSLSKRRLMMEHWSLYITQMVGKRRSTSD